MLPNYCPEFRQRGADDADADADVNAERNEIKLIAKKAKINSQLSGQRSRLRTRLAEFDALVFPKLLMLMCYALPRIISELSKMLNNVDETYLVLKVTIQCNKKAKTGYFKKFFFNSV